jgi:hypothetical protein
MTKGDISRAWRGLPDETIIEIHVPANLTDVDADFMIGKIGQVSGPSNPPWFTLEVGEFIANCGG